MITGPAPPHPHSLALHLQDSATSVPGTTLAQVGPREKPGRASGKQTSSHCCGAWAAEGGQGRGTRCGERVPGASGEMREKDKESDD